MSDFKKFDSNPLFDAKYALQMMSKNMYGSDIVDFSNYSACYPFSNENLSSYYPLFDMSGGRVLTVCGSGDQVLMAILYGAKVVDCFDSNCFAYYNLMLKKYAIMHLEYKDFYSLYNLSNRNGVNRTRIYSQFREKIDDNNVREFWDYIFSFGCMSLGVQEFFPYFFKKRDENMNDVIARIPYLLEIEFLKLKRLLNSSQINFRNCDLFDIFEENRNIYNFINFSNIFNYVDDKLCFYKFVKKTICEHLTYNGNIMINYSMNAPYDNGEINDVSEKLGAHQIEISDVCYDGHGMGSITVVGKG